MTNSPNVRRFMAVAATVVALPLAFHAANANAESANTGSRIVELADLDLTKPLPSNICFVDSAKGTAASKLNTALQARGQKSIIISDKVGKTDDVAKIMTSNLVQVKPDVPNLFGEGYSVGSNDPSNTVSSKYCMNTLRRTYAIYNEAVQQIPGVFAYGEMGKALTNAGQKGSKFAFGGITDKGTLLSVNFNGDTKRGGIMLADGGGNTAIFYPIANARYSPNLTVDARNILGLPPVAQAEQPTVTLARR